MVLGVDFMITNNRTIASIDVTKFFFCLCIIALHTRLFTLLPEPADYYFRQLVLRSAVPFFFVCSGYFLGKKSQGNDVNCVVRKYVKRLLLPLLFFDVINVIEQDIALIYRGEYLIDVLRINAQSLLFYPYGALWFVQACIIGALLLTPFIKRGHMTRAIWIGLCLYIFALLCNNYYFLSYGILRKVIDTYMHYCISARNGLFVGFIFLALGVRIAACDNAYGLRKGLLLLVVGIFSLFVEAYFLRGKAYADDGALFLMQLFFIPCLFNFILHLKFNQAFDTVLLRNLSIGMYLLHRPVLFIIEHISETIVVGFVCTVLITMAICLFFYNTRFLKMDKLLK